MQNLGSEVICEDTAMDLQRCSTQDSKSTSCPDEEKSSACFDCNICLDFASDPIVTLCGHLYCWTCIYKWIDSQRSESAPCHCPVCKARISEKTVVPLYGPGQSLPESDHECNLIIPPRPRLEGDSWLRSSDSHHEIEPLSCCYPFGEMVYARVFRNSMSLYTYPTSYHDAWDSVPRLRRRASQADRSLSRVAIFMFCCLLLCLLLF